jgi:hypothetical protein
VKLHEVDLVSELLQLDFLRLNLRVLLLQLMCEMLFLTSKCFNLILRCDIQLSHFFLQELDLEVLLLKLILKQPFLVSVEFLACRRKEAHACQSLLLRGY